MIKKMFFCFLFSMVIGDKLFAKKFEILTSFTIIKDMAQNVVGDKAIVKSITKPNAEIHYYQVTPKDIVKAQRADLVLYNGLNLETWFKKFLSNVKNVPSVVVTKGIKPLSIYEGAYSGKPNPHAWMSPNNAIIYINNIKNAMVKYDAKNKTYYEKNAKAYINKIKKLDLPFRKQINTIPKKDRWLVTSEGAFSYLAKDYDFKELYLWPINADEQGTPQQVKKLIDKIRKDKIKVIFSESTISNKPAKQVAKETKIKYGGVLYVDSLSNKNGKVPTYIDLLKVTIETIVKAYKD